MKAISSLELAACRGFHGVLCDIDDTLTWHGRLVPAAFMALHRLRDAGLVVVPVTGRPGGWVDQIARLWPVHGVVGENGGLWFRIEGDRMLRCFAQPSAVRQENRARLDALASEILAAVPGSALASDQPYRELDLAIDFCEDVAPLSSEAIDRIVQVFRAAGANCKVSSIHVNGWFGDFDKLAGCQALVRALGFDLNEEPERWIYVGDSPNDAPMFRFFPHSVGVANVRQHLDRMDVSPTYVTNEPGGHGFAEVAEHVLQALQP